MKVELWYKYHQFIEPCKLEDVEIVTERPGIQSKSGYHLVVSENDLPKPSVPPVSAKLPEFPSTLLGIRNYPTMKGIAHLGKAASLLPDAGYEASSIYPSLLRRLVGLAEAYDTLRQELLKIPVDTLRQVDEEVDGKTGTAK